MRRQIFKNFKVDKKKVLIFKKTDRNEQILIDFLKDIRISWIVFEILRLLLKNVRCIIKIHTVIFKIVTVDKYSNMMENYKKFRNTVHIIVF